MDRSKKIETATRQTLESLDKLQRAPANPWLLTRIRAKLEAEGQPSVWFLKPGFQVAVFSMILLLNGLALFSNRRQNQEQQLVEAVANQFGLQSEKEWSLFHPNF